MAFSNTLKANSAVGIVEPVKREAAPESPSYLPVEMPTTHGIDNTDNTNPFTSPSENEAHTQKQWAIRTLVAMPAYNEENQIAKTILGSRKYVDAVLVVDDGSTDATGEIAEALGAIVARHEVNKGYGGALQAIFNTARNLGAEELVIIDSDGQHDPKEIPKLLDKLREGYDVVIGSRFIEGMDSSIPTYRKVGMKVLDKATTMASGDLTITDSQSGFRAYGKRAIQSIKINGSGMDAGSEILIRVNEYHLTVGEVPIKVRYDIANTSTQNPFSHGLNILGRLIGIVGYKRPLISFGLPGTIFVLLGLVVGSWAFAEYQLTSKFSYPASMMSILFMIMGLLLVTTAFILNSLMQIVKMERGKQ